MLILAIKMLTKTVRIVTMTLIDFVELILCFFQVYFTGQEMN